MNQTELPECEKINKKEPSKDVQMTQKQAERLVEHLKNIFMYVHRPSVGKWKPDRKVRR